MDQDLRIIRSARKTLSLEVNQRGEIVVRAPRLLSKKAIDGFLEKNETWITKHQKKVLDRLNEVKQKKYDTGEKFLFLGNKYSLFLVKNQKELLLFADAFYLSLDAEGREEEIFKKWYRKKAREVFEKRIDFYSKLMNIKYNKLKLSSAKNRWGSASLKGYINLNWKLIMSKAEIIDYVIVHELAHLVHHNHSKAFWSLVEKFCHTYKDLRKELKEMGHLYVI